MRAMGAVWMLALLAAQVALAEEVAPENTQEAVMEEIVVEAPFDIRLDLSSPSPTAVQIMIDRLTLRAETQRALEMQIANRNPLNTLLDLTKYSPIPLGASENRIDSFFLQSYLRADPNPRTEDPLSLRR